jgi:stringent starvation protein B
MSSIKPSRPYLLRALYEWVLDNNLTPHLAVDATLPGVQVPQQFVQNGQITLNIAPSAVQGLMIEEHGIRFNARFGGVPMNVYIPMVAVMAIFARENGMGMGFGVEPGVEELLKQVEAGGRLPDDEPPKPPAGGRKPVLRMVK